MHKNDHKWYLKQGGEIYRWYDLFSLLKKVENTEGFQKTLTRIGEWAQGWQITVTADKNPGITCWIE